MPSVDDLTQCEPECSLAQSKLTVRTVLDLLLLCSTDHCLSLPLLALTFHFVHFRYSRFPLTFSASYTTLMPFPVVDFDASPLILVARSISVPLATA